MNFILTNQDVIQNQISQLEDTIKQMEVRMDDRGDKSISYLWKRIRLLVEILLIKAKVEIPNSFTEVKVRIYCSVNE